MIYSVENFSIDVDIGDAVRVLNSSSSSLLNRVDIIEGLTYFIEDISCSERHVWAHFSKTHTMKFSLIHPENFELIKNNKQINLQTLIKQIIKNNGKI